MDRNPPSAAFCSLKACHFHHFPFAVLCTVEQLDIGKLAVLALGLLRILYCIKIILVYPHVHLDDILAIINNQHSNVPIYTIKLLKNDLLTDLHF